MQVAAAYNLINRDTGVMGDVLAAQAGHNIRQWPVTYHVQFRTLNTSITLPNPRCESESPK